MARKKKQTYEDFLKKASYEYLEIQINYWCDLIDRYVHLEDHIKLSEAETNLKLVKQYKAKYEQDFLNRFNQDYPTLSHLVNLSDVKKYLEKNASSNPLFKASTDLFKDYILSNNIEYIEL